MDNFDELLGRCESEPIHLPGSIQPHGVLIAIDGLGIVRAISDNLELLGRQDRGADTAAAIGRPVIEILGAEAASALVDVPPGEPQSVRLPSGEVLDLTTQHVGDLRLVELERESHVDLHERTTLGRLLQTLQVATSVDALLGQIVEAVHELTGFDRVMVYRFDESWNGTVAAERASSGLPAFLGLRYPASDIPPQARALYLRNRVRLIPDVSHVPVPLVVSSELDAGSLDLSDSTLRAVSPVHLEYLRNMGVAASASIALIVDGRLWGLIACHHYRASLRPSQRIRTALDVLSGTASALLGAHIATAEARAQIALTERLDVLARALLDEQSSDPLGDLDASGLVALLDADGVVVTRTGSPHRRGGDCPTDLAVDALVADLVLAQRRDFVSTQIGAESILRPLPPPRSGEPGSAFAGVVAIRWGDEGDWLIWFRAEQIRSIRWGGDPDLKEVVHGANGPRLGPRHSFEEYVETVRGTSSIWTTQQVAVAREMGRRIADGVARRGRRERSLAAVVQRALLLDAVPEVPGADVAVLYRPADHSSLGGDWFDVYFLPDGRAVVALGDVAGHGMEVAATMAQLRHALRAYVLREADLASAMARLNDLSCTLLPGDIASLVIAVIDPGDRTMEVINAGHLPAVIGHGRQGAEFAPLPRNPALGLSRTVAYRAAQLSLAPGDGLVLYTDGLVERRTGSLEQQLDRVLELVSSAGAASSESVCSHLVEQFDPDGTDDVTVLVLRFLDETEPV